MEKILIVDDRPANRDFLATLLGYRKFGVLQASDGHEALVLARREHPDLIISDILMPTMDGYELVRQLRMDPEIAQTQVIFTSAHFLSEEAHTLAESCGVRFLLPKPSEPEAVLDLVDTALRRAHESSPAPTPDFDRRHLRLVTDKLRETADQLRTVNAKLTALIEVAQELALERDPDRLFRGFARAAREIIGARYCVVVRSDSQCVPPVELFSSGLDVALTAVAPDGEAGVVLDRLLASAGTHRSHTLSSDRAIQGLPAGHPPVHSLLACSIVSLTRIYGWVCVTEKIAFDAFSEDDERLLGILGAQLGRIYENGRLYADLALRTTELEKEVVARTQAAAALADRARLAALGADVGVALTRGGLLPSVLQDCAAALVKHLDAAFARIWTLNARTDVLELQASAGMYTHLDGPHSRVPVGALKIGLIAANRRPHLTNEVPDDPLISDPQWARREGMVAFAGHPLIVEGQLVGVMALFARQALSGFTIEALGSIADEIALGIRRHRIELEVRQNERRFQSLMRNASDLVMVLDEAGGIQYASPSHERIVGYRPDEIVGRSGFDSIHPDDLPVIRAVFAASKMTLGYGEAREYRQRCKDGTWRVLEGTGLNLLDDPAVGGIVVNSWDVTTRKRAEERTRALLNLAEDLAGTLDLERILDCAHRHASAILACDAVATFASDTSRETFGLIGQWAMWDALLRVASSSELRSGIAGYATKSSEATLINEPGGLPDPLRGLVAQAGVGALIVAPLQARDRDRGALVAFRAVGGPPFEAVQGELCVGIAKQLAVAMEAVDLHRVQRDEATIARALAQAGTELIGALGQPRLLERLCQITLDALECDVSGTMLRQPDSTWVHVASAGWTPEEQEAVHAPAVPHALMATLVARLAGDEIVQIPLWRLPADWAELPHREGIESIICMPLRRSGEVIGVHTAGFRRRSPNLTSIQQRIGQGLGTLASLALDDALMIERLDRANRLKSEFVATMSHELRTPLNIIIGYNDLLRSGEFGPVNQDQVETMERINENGHNLLDLVTATLDIGRLESGNAPLDLSDVDLAELFGELRHEIRRPEAQSTVRVHWPVLAAELRLRTDRLKLKVILKNLIDNALKFTEEGRVDLTVEPAAGAVAITVSDTGIGIPPSGLETIFEWFRQLEPAMTRRHGGVGLGLYLVRRLTEMLGGTITVESQVGRGSAFRVAIPDAAPPSPPAAD